MDISRQDISRDWVHSCTLACWLEQPGWSPITMPPQSLGYPAGEREQEKGRSGDTRWLLRLWEGECEALAEFLMECKWHGWGSQHCTEQKNPQAWEIICYLSCNVLSVCFYVHVCVSYINRKQKHRMQALDLRGSRRDTRESSLSKSPSQCSHRCHSATFLALGEYQVLAPVSCLCQLSAHPASESLSASFILYTAFSGQISLEIRAA